ncbi:MAG: phosphoadenosine phosphosulfate reductase family protein [Candidatus Hodarchaeota archaeon]
MELIPEELFYKEIDAKDFIRGNLKNTAVSISGGKDSLVALDLSIRVGIKKFVFGNTTLTYPGTLEYIKKLEKYYNIIIDKAVPERPFLDLVKDLGFPSRRLRWCCEVYKFGPLTHYVLKSKIKYLITGIRAEESNKRKKYEKISKNPLIPAIQINPILEWTEEDVWNYINHYEIPYHPLYNIGYDRLGCWLCPFQNEGDFKRLKDNFPELYRILITSLTENVKKFGKVGVRELNDYVYNFGWLTNALPIRNIKKGTIQFSKTHNVTKYKITCFNKKDFFKILKNLELLKKYSISISTDNDSHEIDLKSSILDTNKILIYTEKQVNCVGCGACKSLCPNSAIKIWNNQMIIDFEKCSFCLNCLKSNKMRAGCISRNYMPIRKKFVLRDINGEYSSLEKNLLESDGLIKTRKKLPEVIVKLSNFFINTLKKHPNYSEINNVYTFSTNDLFIVIRKKQGFTLVDLKCSNDKIEDNLNLLINVLKN